MDTGLLNVILNIIAVLMSGGALGVVLRYVAKIKELKVGQRSSDRDDDRADFEVIIKELSGQRDKANDRATACDLRIDQLEAEIQGLRVARDLDPFPSWLVDLGGRYTYVNRPFEERFLEPKKQTHRDIVGKTSAQIWPEDFCRTLRALDAAARKRPDGTARANTSLDVPGLGASEVTVHKFPCRINGIVVAYAGYITVIEPEERAVA
jgi:PAS domain-containing protein